MACDAPPPATLGDVVCIQGVAALVLTRLPVLDRVRMRGLSRGVCAAVDDSLTLLTRLSGDDLAGVKRHGSWLQGLLWLLPRCPNLRTFVAGGLLVVDVSLPSVLREDDPRGEYMGRSRARRRADAHGDEDGGDDCYGVEGLDVDENDMDDDEPGEWGEEEEDEEEDEEEEEDLPQIPFFWWTVHSTHRVLRGLVDYCHNLSHLDLEGCSKGVTDEIVSALAPRMPRLRQLQLSRCVQVTDASMHVLARHCPQLQHLSFRRTTTAHHGVSVGITDAGVRAIAEGCPGLRTLCVPYCRRVANASLMAVAENCPLLLRLDVSRTGVTFAGLCAVLLNCPLLRTLVCEGLGEVAMMVQLQENDFPARLRAWLSSPFVPSTPTAHNTQSQLRHLNLRGGKSLFVGDLRLMLRHCPSLASLVVSDNHHLVMSTGIAEHCPQLRHLDVSNTSVTNDVLSAVAERCVRLRHLDVSNTSVTDVVLSAVAERCARLRHLDVSWCRLLTPGIVKQITARCPRLRGLRLRGYRFDEAGALFLGEQCPGLRMLDLTNCQATTVRSWGLGGGGGRDGWGGWGATPFRVAPPGWGAAPGWGGWGGGGANPIWAGGAGGGGGGGEVGGGRGGGGQLDDGSWVIDGGLGCAQLLQKCHHLRHLAVGCWQPSSGWDHLRLGTLFFRHSLSDRALADSSSQEGPAPRGGAICEVLEHLEICGCAQLTDAALGALLARCRRLRTLDLTGCASVTDACLTAVAEYCRQLRCLDLKGCIRVTDVGIRMVALGCPRLEQLGLRGCTGVSPAGLQQLVMEDGGIMPQLKVLNKGE